MTSIKTTKEGIMKEFTEKFGDFYVSIDSKTRAIRIVDIMNGIKVKGEDGNEIECVASTDIKQYIYQVRAESFKAGKLAGYEEEAVKCHEHCESAKKDEHFKLNCKSCGSETTN